MRAGLLALAILVPAACGPKVSTAPRAFDDDLDVRPAPAAAAAAPAPARPAAAPRSGPAAAAPGKGVRTGTIARARLVAVLDAGPGTFLRQLEVAPRLAGNRFVGWQLVELLDRSGPLHDVDVAPGDVLLAVNGKPVARPEQLQALWDSLRTANEVTAQLRRGDQPLELRFTVEPPLAGSPAPPAAGSPAPPGR
jgi:S1-C subfamily serine protease